ncbi:hypothetical protein [Mycobacterium sp.]|uniref:hypothetical protein n=1 Tax=Mycobacterium sp. TaxID=1785 RepID=UPI003F9572A1
MMGPSLHSPSTGSEQLVEAFLVLAKFLQVEGLTARLAAAESALVTSSSRTVEEITARYGFSRELLDAALAVRAEVGRLNDVIHASTIALVLPHILGPGECVVNRPSLGAGNDPSRPFDLETDQRVAEFKVAQWKGADTVRKRGVFADLVRLALDDSGRRAELYVVGTLPMQFLRGSTSKADWMLSRSSSRTRERFAATFDSTGTMTVAEFTNGPASNVQLLDLASLVPSLMT